MLWNCFAIYHSGFYVQALWCNIVNKIAIVSAKGVCYPARR